MHHCVSHGHHNIKTESETTLKKFDILEKGRKERAHL